MNRPVRRKSVLFIMQLLPRHMEGRPRADGTVNVQEQRHLSGDIWRARGDVRRWRPSKLKPKCAVELHRYLATTHFMD